MPEPGEVSPGRKLVATLGMLGTAGAFGHMTAGAEPRWLMLAFTAMLAAAGLGLTRGSILTRILARGVAWLMVPQTVAYLVLTALAGRLPALEMVTIAVASGIAIFAARPALETPSALAEFAPKAWRRVFLGGATIATAAASGLLCDAIAELARPTGSIAVSLGFVAVAASMLTSVVGVMRMRGWGVLLGTATSLGLFVAALLGAPHAVLPLEILALPTLLGFLAPILLSRLGVGHGGTRVALDTSARARVALDDETAAPAEEPLDEAPLPQRRAASSLPCGGRS